MMFRNIKCTDMDGNRDKKADVRVTERHQRGLADRHRRKAFPCRPVPATERIRPAHTTVARV